MISSHMKLRKQADELNERVESILEGIGIWAGYYRKHPDIFARDFLGLTLKLYQRILLIFMFYSTNFMFLGARGISKTFTTAIFAVSKAILYPGSQICITSKTLKQACDVLNKIKQELMPKSGYLRNEIRRIDNVENTIEFKNGSIIFAVTANENSRGKRATVLICDEFVKMKEEIIDTILRKFLTVQRHPEFLNRPEYANNPRYRETNQEFYLSSCWLKSSWSWKKVRSYAVNMVDYNKKYFLCGLPYQLSMREGLLDREAVENEMSEETFSQMKWDIEMGCLFYGESEKSFFQYDELMNVRNVVHALYPSSVYMYLPKTFKRFSKAAGEVRILSVDLALMSSRKRKNDATAIYVLQLLPTKSGQYLRNVVYAETHEGGHTETQAINIRKLFDQMECDYIAIDTNGAGIGIFDMLVTDLTCPDSGEIYPAFTCFNDSEMANRYKGASPHPPKVIYSIKATNKFNSECAVFLKDCIRRGKLRLLVGEKEYEEAMYETSFYAGLDEALKLELKLPYIQTTLTVNELVNLDCTLQGSEIRIAERGQERKDRYSSLSYGNFLANELERQLRNLQTDTDVFLPIRAPKTRSRIERW